ncbi:ferredoxin:protochlorophyllide reductase (ATP-dependent) subunit B [Parerythrobacter aurantius]|uniref:ferredoxin:protochlorophyllide reductase (ATP-dependent) subunit B n=1 Tax=Parerythrobacter aurantius TaxID=3127706 RepID=UPI003248059A
MQLAVWTYEGPPHVGAMRVATAMRGIHYLLHAPQGDTYADLLFTMIERRGKRPPVTYTTFQARDLGKDTSQLFQDAACDVIDRFKPDAMLVGASCTAELIQDDPAGLVEKMGLPIPVVPLELPSYQRKEHWGAAETFYQIVRTLADKEVRPSDPSTRRPLVNLLGPTALGFRHRDDIVEMTRLLNQLGIDVNVVAPLGADAADIARLGAADFNIVMYPETGDLAADWLKRTFRQPVVRTVPIGVGATQEFVREVSSLAGVDPAPLLSQGLSRLPWWSRSVDSNYLTGKRVFIFGDGTHAVAAARIAHEELGFKVCGLGCYNREYALDVRAMAEKLGLAALITDDHLAVEAAIGEAQPELVLGTQMERHIAKRLGVPCAVISSPVHVQDFPARHSPQMGFEGANVIFDDWVHPLVMGLEEHLLTMFSDDFEFNDGAGPSHLGPGHAKPANEIPVQPANDTAVWSAEAERELKKIPFFVRGKARRNTELFAAEQGVARIELATLYEAKAHYAR